MLTANSTRLLTTTEAGELLGVSRFTVLNMLAAGELESVTTVGGHNRVTIASVNCYLGYDDAGDDDAGRKVHVYLRVSSQGQKDSLVNQRAKMVDWACEKFGVEASELVIIQDIASSFNARKGLNTLIDAVIAGKVSHIACHYPDRLSRTSSEKRLIEHLCEQNGVQIHFAQKAIDVADSQILIVELTEFMTVVTNKISGRKGGEAVRMVASEASKARILSLHRAGMVQSAIVEQMEVENHRCEKTGKLLTIHIVRSVIIAHEQAERMFAVAPAKIENPITQFVAERCQLKADGKCFSTPLYRAYMEFCSQRSLEPMGPHAFTRWVSRHWNLPTEKSSSGYTWLSGICLPSNERASRSHLA